MILLLDPGGTRLKWAWMDGQDLLEFGGASWPEAANQLSGSLAQAKLRYPSRSVSVHMLKRATPEQALQTGFPHWLNELVEGRWSELDPMALASFEVTYHDGNPGSDGFSCGCLLPSQPITEPCHHRRWHLHYGGLDVQRGLERRGHPPGLGLASPIHGPRRAPCDWSQCRRPMAHAAWAKRSLGTKHESGH